MRIFPPLDCLRQSMLLLLLLLAGCARGPIERTEQALRPTTNIPDLHEASGMDALVQNLERNIEFIRSSHRVNQFRFGERVFTREEYLRGMEYLLEILRGKADAAAAWQSVQENFDFYEVYGRKDWGEVFITSYYEPVIEARHKPEAPFTQPLYGLPEDLVEIKLRQFGEEFSRFSAAIRGRYKPADASGGIASVEPFFSRAEIDESGSLRNRRLELAYVDPIESFFLQIQGSGVLHFPDGEEMRVGYAGQNGHAYEPIGKFLKQALPNEEISLQRIESFLRSLSAKEMQAYLNRNPSYVFFKPTKQNAVTYIGTPAEGLRTIATDAKYFPKGAVVLLKFQKPEFSEDGKSVKAWSDVAQLMIDQDVGGAIRGADRVDLFWGRGNEAKRHAGVIKQNGYLYYMAPKQTLLDSLREKGK